MCLWQQNQVSQTWSSPNQAVYVPKPNHTICTEMLSCNMKKHKFSTHQMYIFNISVVWTDVQSQHLFWWWGSQGPACFRRHALLSYLDTFLVKLTSVIIWTVDWWERTCSGSIFKHSYIPKTTDKLPLYLVGPYLHRVPASDMWFTHIQPAEGSPALLLRSKNLSSQDGQKGKTWGGSEWREKGKWRKVKEAITEASIELEPRLVQWL